MLLLLALSAMSLLFFFSRFWKVSSFWSSSCSPGSLPLSRRHLWMLMGFCCSSSRSLALARSRCNSSVNTPTSRCNSSACTGQRLEVKSHSNTTLNTGQKQVIVQVYLFYGTYFFTAWISETMRNWMFDKPVFLQKSTKGDQFDLFFFKFTVFSV